METVLWALDLLAVVYACRWALRQDKAEAEAEAGKRTANLDGPKE